MRMMSRCFTCFPLVVIGEPNIYHDSGGFYKEVGRSVEGVCESYKYLHLTGLWLGVMNRDNATDRQCVFDSSFINTLIMIL